VEQELLPRRADAVWSSFYRTLPPPGDSSAIESTGYAPVVIHGTDAAPRPTPCLVGRGRQDPGHGRAPRRRPTARDAQHLLDLLKHDRFPAVWIPDPATRDLRALVTHRGPALVRIRNQWSKNGLQAIALNPPPRSGFQALESARGRAQLVAPRALPPHTAQRRGGQPRPSLAWLEAHIAGLDRPHRRRGRRRPSPAPACSLTQSRAWGALTAPHHRPSARPHRPAFPGSKHVVSYGRLGPRP